MSHIAINKHSEVVLSSQVKDFFLETGTLDNPFFCVFCEISVFPRAYMREELEVAAHFRVTSKPHVPGCPYGKGGTWEGSDRRATRVIFKEKLFLPNRLIARRPAAERIAGPGPGGGVAGSLDIEGRFKKYGGLVSSGGVSTTSVLETVVEAWRAARKICYRAPQTRNAKDEHKFVREKLSNYDLELFGLKSDYDRAFHKFSSNWRGAAVHYGYAKVRATVDGFDLVSQDIVSRTNEPFPGLVRVIKAPLIQNQMTTALLKELGEASLSGMMVHWFGYGEINADSGSGAPLILIADSALLYLRSL